MITRIICITSLFLIALTYNLNSQSSNCPKIRVGVNIEEVYPEVFDHLDKDYSTKKQRAVWLAELGEKLMENLRNNSPEIEFIYLPSNPGADYDYLFKTLIALTGGGADIEVVPEQTIIEGDNVITVPPIYRSEYIDYLVLSSLIVNSNCYPSRRYILMIEKKQNRDIDLAIAGNVVQFWRLINIIEARENERPVPPREPTVETRLEKEYVSPLFAETRQMKIYEKVVSCNGVPAYFQFDHSQPIKFPEKTERGNIEPADNCKCYNSGGGVQYILVNEGGDAVGEYTLKRGLSPQLEKMTLTTCPLGNKPVIERDIEIIIRGLELLVEPWRNTIHNGEKTTIAIDLHEIDPDGNKFPVIQREVQIKVTGLVDGSVSSSDKVTTDDMGVAWIDYKAGQKDTQIRITATFTPPGYPEEVKGEATINVKPLEYDATLTVRGNYKKTQSSSYNEASGTGVSDGTYNLNESREASFYVPLRFENAYDVPIQNQRWEFYRPLDINLSNFNASVRIRYYDHAESSSGGFRQTVTTTKTPVNRRVAAKEYLLQSNIILIIDKKTDKVVKIATGGFGVEFEWTGNETATGREWSVDPPKEKPINRSTPLNEDDTFNAQPVEDLIPDPTFVSVSESLRKYMKDLKTPLPANIEITEDEEVPEIEPDLLVKFGDGKTYFGGDGKKIIENSEGSTVDREEFNFSWQVTRKKKPL
jgi:hypothetical protein